MRTLRIDCPSNPRTVNQLLYAPLCRHPTMISIEVKVNGTEEEARVQIGIWLSAWHEREILQFTESIGDTWSLVKVYRILAVLRRLGEWGLETFEPWFKATFLDLEGS
ncbi:uncharacterized protein BDR25DRAFT_342193 [Lindgomyces ingoldianus]|uniref:Uncharacterized protein n=1 Tax=Lindgomyces ingoldianus TaxID=673940 RepID=A0ACB6QYU0_9PLEO|nr:uncharacterized protein BDR25DRAFT_342193 [Lindgomyces ingoldianus]KAF2472219.1 hypothetical protein BDR25DRAFT_342193 [Lindgomyces ingoldianus]